MSLRAPESNATTLRPESTARRRLPLNLKQDELRLFSGELERVIPATSVVELNDVRASSNGFLFKGLTLLPESFAFPENRQKWLLRGVIKFFFNNYARRRARKVDRPALWVTDDWSSGYFHWLTDVLSRLYVMRDRLDELVLLLPSEFEALDLVQSTLKCFPVRQVEFIAPDEVLVCSRLLVPTHPAPSGHYNEEIIRGVRRLLLQSYGAANDRGDERLYVSRGRARKRNIANEAAMLEVLGEFGFRTLYAEDYSFAEQVQMFSRARHFVSNHGAGMTNMLFQPEGASVLELRHQSDSINNCYFTLSSALNLNYFYQSCQAADSSQNPHLANLIVDLDALRKNLTLLVGS